MASGLTAYYLEGLMTGVTTNGLNDVVDGTSDVFAALYNDSASPAAGTISDAANQDLTALVGGNIEDNSHFADLSTKTVGSVAAYVFDAADTVITSAAAGGSNAKSVLIGLKASSGGSVVAGDEVLAIFDLTDTVTPNGQNITVTWNNSGIWKFGPDPA